MKEIEKGHSMDKKLAEMKEEYEKLLHDAGIEGESDLTLEQLQQKLGEM